jgi:hypothetical protein
MSTSMNPHEKPAMNASRPVDQQSVRPDLAVRSDGYQQALQRIQEAQQTGQPDLDLSGLQLPALSPELIRLTNLQELDLDENPLGEPLPGDSGTM